MKTAAVVSLSHVPTESVQPGDADPAQLPSVVVDRVSKRFSVPADKMQTLKERALHPVRSRQRNEFSALNEVSFHIERGEFFGLVGRNGSGKSTLLKCIAGIYESDAGEIHHQGTIASFIELGVGFNPELAAFDNVILNATLMGMDANTARESYGEIMDFAELWPFENLKLKNYSSGMYVRLAFSVMLQIDADILLIDEVLAVGDASFQQKCFDEFGRMRAEGKTIIFVSHGMDAVKRFCDRAALLHKGELLAVGDAESIGNRYLTLNFDEESEHRPAKSEHAATLLDIWVQPVDGERDERIPGQTDFELRGVVRFETEVEDPRVTVDVFSTNQQLVSRLQVEAQGHKRVNDAFEFVISCAGVLSPGRYVVSAFGDSQSPGGLFSHDLVAEFFVEGDGPSGPPLALQKSADALAIGGQKGVVS